VDLLTEAIGLGESPRWHDGRLYVSDWAAGVVVAVAADGTTTPVAPVAAPAFCFDFLPDGRLLVVEGDRLVAGPPGGTLEPYAALPAPGHWNDVVVDGRGNAYVGALGFDFGGGEEYPGGPTAPGAVALVRPDGTVEVVAADCAFPNGIAVTPDNGTLILAESYGYRLTAWDVAADGTLSGRRVWAALGEGVPPDGICLDATGAVWYADVPNRRCVRVAEGGAVLDTVELDRGAFACMLGGTTLYVVANSWGGVGDTAGGRVHTVPAPAPGAGWPGAG
jgi:sugar lactone lactonase YvrE